MAALGALLVVGGLIYVAWHSRHSGIADTATDSAAPAPRLSRLTSFPGMEEFPALSPDGEQVAFTWTTGTDNPQGIFVTIVGSADKRQITSGACDGVPAWSPDGRQIAFLRCSDGGPQVYVVSSLGGAARRVNERFVACSGRPAWSPDSGC